MNEVAPVHKQNPLVEFKQSLDRLKANGEMDMLPSNVSFDAFKNAAVVAFTDNPLIAKCEMGSVFKSLRRLAAAGLVPDGREAALVPFKTKIDGQYVQVCQAMPMIFGLIKTARNSGEVSDIRAHIVYEREFEEGRFSYTIGDTERLEHQPILFGNKGEPIAAYAVATMKDGSIIREFMDAGEIDKVRRSGASQLDFSQGGRPTVSEKPKGIWADWQGEMWKKTVIRRMIKRLPISAEDMRRVAELDEIRHEVKDITPQPKEPRPNLAQRLSGATITGEIMPEQDPAPHWTETVDTTEAFPGSDVFGEGAQAFTAGKALADCPYPQDMSEHVDWIGGWQMAARAKE